MPESFTTSNLHPYFPILLYILIGLAFGIFTLLFGSLLRPSSPNPEKLSPYECGNPPFMDARQRVFVRYYLIAVLFVLFDLEAVFLYPWAVVYNKIGIFGLVEMVLFILMLLVGYIYAWRKGAFEWD
jgi:NADH-quinone oxidoreductase subunit A